MVWQAGRFRLELARPLVMGIVNVTPDSFSDGDPAMTAQAAIGRCEQLVAEGADLLDLGGESSRPGAEPVGVDEELARVLPVLSAALRLGVPVSVDTAKPEVMRAVLDEGADIVNDIGALVAPGAVAAVAANAGCGVCLMHMRGSPRSMAGQASYDDVVGEVAAFLRARIDAACAAGIDAQRIVVDAGIGFAKTAAHNLALLRRQRELLGLGRPLLVGWSRKSTLARLIGLPAGPGSSRTTATMAALDVASATAVVLAVQAGASIVRVHNVAATVAALAVWRAAGAAPG
ncbi:MAG: dihydropteroate synthase [Caldimonas sp.]